jgi:hypothetical protein
MIQSDRIYHLENQTFIVSNNVDCFPVQRISFSSSQTNEEISGILQGEGISSGRFTGKFFAKRQIELIFQWFDRSTLHFVTGRMFGFICGNPSGKVQIFLNWYCLYGKQGYGAASYSQLQ